MNKVILIGRLTKPPAIRNFSDKYSVITFTLAVHRKYQSKDGPEADFIRCTAWNSDAKFIDKYFSKGDSICVAGELRNNQYTDEAGQTKYSTEVNVSEVYFTGSSMKK